MQGMFRLVFGFDELRATGRQLPDALQRRREQRADAAIDLAGADGRGVLLVEQQRQQHEREGLIPSIALAPYIDTRTGSPTIGTLINPNSAQTALVNAAVAADLPLFQGFDVYTTRKRSTRPSA